MPRPCAHSCSALLASRASSGASAIRSRHRPRITARAASRPPSRYTAAITASSPEERDAFFDPAADKIYRHPTFYDVPEGVEHL